MITFKNYLTEARMAPLYHGTNLSSAYQILTQGAFNVDTIHQSFLLLKTPYRFLRQPGLGGESIPIIMPKTNSNSNRKLINGLSTTRDYRFAKSWCLNQLDLLLRYIVIFEFDQQALTHRYQVKPVSYWLGRRLEKVVKTNESEEFILSDKPIPLKYVTKIFAGNVEEMKDKIRAANINIPVEPLK